MNLSIETLTILKNFSLLNDAILLRPGNILRTISQSQAILTRATVEEEFPIECAIYGLSRFLAAVSMFKRPNLEFNSTFVDIIGEEEDVIRYFYHKSNKIVSPPNEDVELEEVHDQFFLSKEEFQKLIKSASLLQVPHFIINNDEKGRVLKVCDGIKLSSNSYSLTNNTCPTNNTYPSTKNYCFPIAVDNLKFLQLDYDVKIGTIGDSDLVEFKNDICTYWVAVETTL